MGGNLPSRLERIYHFRYQNDRKRFAADLISNDGSEFTVRPTGDDGAVFTI
jgi:hypothetical protein